MPAGGATAGEPGEAAFQGETSYNDRTDGELLSYLYGGIAYEKRIEIHAWKSDPDHTKRIVGGDVK